MAQTHGRARTRDNKKKSASKKAAPARRSGTTKGLTLERLLSVERIGQPIVSPSGRSLIYATTRPQLEENTSRQSIFRVDLRTKTCYELTPGEGKHKHPAFAPDAHEIAFVSDRDDEGEQLWVLPKEGGEAHRVTRGWGGVGPPVWAPDNRHVAFSRKVVVSDDYKPRKDEEDGPSEPSTAEVFGLTHPRSTARIADELLFRHWDTWRDRKRSHLFITDTKSGKTVDVTPFDCDVPPISLGSDIDYAFSPEGDEIAYVMNPDSVVAVSTNNSIFAQKLRGMRPSGKPVCISVTDACDCHPRYTPDGRYLVYLGMEVPGYEADRNRIRVYDRETGQTRTLLERFDRSPSTFVFDGTEPNRVILFVAEDRGRRTLYRVEIDTGKVRQLTHGGYVGRPATIPGSSELIVSRESVTAPADFFRIRVGAGWTPNTSPGPDTTDPSPENEVSYQQLTRYRDAVPSTRLNEAEEFWFAGADGTPVHGFLVRPPGFQKGQKYPLILLIHGGPQAAFGDNFHYRWSSQVFASRGAVVAKINPRGSTGYGQKFTDQISGDWGGRCYKDLMHGLDHLLETHSFLDRERVAAAGASFGGFMVNWIAGHTDRFKALVSHDGIFVAETMAYTTEELWFDQHEHGGFPHENRKAFLKFSPHLFVENFKTPTLVIQGGLDYRCPVSEGIGMFQALQLKGVPSRFLYFPDEGHWVLHHANAKVWYEQVLGWLMKYIG